MRNLTQNQRVYQILWVNVIFSQFCETKTAFREVSVEFKHYHLVQEFLQKSCQGTPETLIFRKITQYERVY